MCIHFSVSIVETCAFSNKAFQFLITLVLLSLLLYTVHQVRLCNNILACNTKESKLTISGSTQRLLGCTIL